MGSILAALAGFPIGRRVVGDRDTAGSRVTSAHLIDLPERLGTLDEHGRDAATAAA
jgi:hypothetical protein